MKLLHNRLWQKVGLLVALLAVVQGVQAMGKMYLFSPLKGVVVESGKPVAGAKVIRRYTWKDDSRQDETTTSSSGEFSFPAITERSLMWSIIPHQPTIMQAIVIEHGGKQYEAWEHRKGNYNQNSESHGKAFVMHCDLAQEPKNVRADAGHSYWGLCELK